MDKFDEYLRLVDSIKKEDLNTIEDFELKKEEIGYKIDREDGLSSDDKIFLKKKLNSMDLMKTTELMNSSMKIF